MLQLQICFRVRPPRGQESRALKSFAVGGSLAGVRGNSKHFPSVTRLYDRGLSSLPLASSRTCRFLLTKILATRKGVRIWWRAELHQTRVPRHQKVFRAQRWHSNAHPKTPKKSVVHHAGHQARIPTDPCTTLAIKNASQDTQKVCRAPCWPSNLHPNTPKKSVVHHAGHQTRIPRHPKSLLCTTLAI